MDTYILKLQDRRKPLINLIKRFKFIFIFNIIFIFVCLLASNGVVLATEKKQKSILYEEHSIHKVESITKNIGMVYSGMGPDYR